MTTHDPTVAPDTTIAYAFVGISGLFLLAAIARGDIATGGVGIIIATTAFYVLHGGTQ